jgi:hypothetical protein
MARKRNDASSAAMHKTLTPPGLFLVRMLVFLTLVAFLIAILHEQLLISVMTNPGLNGLIIGVLAIGIVYAFRQVVRLYPEIRFVNAFRISDPGLGASHQPVLLAPMATMLRDRTGALSLSTVSMRTIMDSIGSRLDEARDTGRYMVGLLVFLGLLGTFWGLLETIQSVGGVIGALDTSGGESVAVFDELKAGLAAPLKGMGTAFSSSLLGLSGSLVLGFLELQASHAHSRFYNELEEWLSGITELTPGSSSATEHASRQLLTAVYEMQRAVEGLSEKVSGGGSIAASPGAGFSGGGGEDVRDLARGVNQLVNQMRAEQKVVREWVDEQASQQADVTNVLRDLAQNMLKRGN